MGHAATTHTDVDSPRRAGEAGSSDALGPESHYPNSPRGTQKGIQVAIFRALWGQRSPLTLRQLHQKTGIPVEHLAEEIAELRSAGHVRRLNTIIESYVPRAAAGERRLTRSLPLPHPRSTTGSDSH